MNEILAIKDLRCAGLATLRTQLRLRDERIAELENSLESMTAARDGWRNDCRMLEAQLYEVRKLTATEGDKA